MSDQFQVGSSEPLREDSLAFAKRDLSVRKAPRRFAFWAKFFLRLLPVLVAVLLLGIRGIWSEEVEFQLLVVDAATQQPIPNCVVLVMRSGEDRFSMMQAGGDGSLLVTRRCSTTGGSVSVEAWYFRVEAPGYEPTGYISADDHRSQIEDRGNGYVLPIRVELKKSHE